MQRFRKGGMTLNEEDNKFNIIKKDL